MKKIFTKNKNSLEKNIIDIEVDEQTLNFINGIAVAKVKISYTNGYQRDKFCIINENYEEAFTYDEKNDSTKILSLANNNINIERITENDFVVTSICSKGNHSTRKNCHIKIEENIPKLIHRKFYNITKTKCPNIIISDGRLYNVKTGNFTTRKYYSIEEMINDKQEHNKFFVTDKLEVEDITADYNSPVTKPENPTREHYTFDNWYIDEELTTPYEFSVMPLNGITLYAKWMGDLHTITWSNIDGTEIYNEQVEYGKLPVYDTETYGVPKYEVDGYTYTFTGWDKEITEVTGDVTYKATYSEEVNTYNIEYYYGETKLEGLAPITYVYGIGTALPTHVVDGYRFEGWYTTSTFDEGTKVESITTTDFGDKVLYVNMVRSEFTITFEENGGTEVEDITKTAGEEIMAPETTREGYVFEGWYSDELLETKYEFSVMPEENITLYAKWSEIQIEILNKDIEMFVDDEVQININTIPEDATITFTYTPTTEIVSVSEEGLIKGLTGGETTITVKVLENSNIEETITVKVNSKEIESSTYSVEQKEDVKIIIGMDEGVTIEELVTTLSNNKDYLSIYNKENEEITDYTQIVSTGLKIKLEKDTKVYDEVTVILRGDINEDGVINITDNLLLQDHILLINTLEDYRVYAAEIVVDDVINITDKVKLADYILKKIDSLN